MTEAILTKKKEMDLFTLDGLQKQTGTQRSEWDIYTIKELMDNCLDACESAGIEPDVNITVRGDCITIRDNGPGITRETIYKVIDLDIYAGSKYYYSRPSRGKQGNAMLTVFALPYVYSKGKITECAVIRSGSKQYTISLQHDDVEQNYSFRVDETDIPDAVKGTEIKINIPTPDPSYWTNAGIWRRAFNTLITGFSVFNPHCKITADYLGQVMTYERRGNIQKMKSESESIHWYSYEAFRDLVYAHIRAGHGNTTIKIFCIDRFRGISNSTKNQDLLISMQSRKLEDLRDKENDIKNLYLNLKTICKRKLSPAVLGEIGESQLHAYFPDGQGSKYKKIEDNLVQENGEDSYEIPFVLEGMAVQYNNSNSTLYAGLNNSPLYEDSSLSTLLSNNPELQIDDGDGIKVALHLICPCVMYTDYSKRRFDLEQFMPSIKKVLKSILSDYYDSRDKAEKERIKIFKEEEKHKEEKRKKDKKQKRDTKREVFFQTIQSVFDKVSEGGFLTDVRNAFYHYRPMIASRDADIDYSYFSDLVAEWEETTKGKRMFLREARGVLLEPGSEDFLHIDTTFVTHFNPKKYKFNKIIYIEKRSFMDAMRSFKIHDRYDIALVGGQGEPTEDIKLLIHKCLAVDSGISVYVFHDCDIYGMHIFDSTSDEHYIEKSQVNTISLGIKPNEVTEKGYPVEYYDPPTSNKTGKIIMFNYEGLENAITMEEFKWLTELFQGKRRRVELNVFTPLKFVKYTEEKLVEYGITEKVLPPVDEIKRKADKVVEEEKSEVVKNAIDKHIKEITDLIDKLKEKIIKREDIEKNLKAEFQDYVEVDAVKLRDKVEEDLKENPPESWEEITENHVKGMFDDLPEWDKHVKELVDENTDKDAMAILTSIFNEKLQKQQNS